MAHPFSEISSLWNNATFMPHDISLRSEMLLEEVWKTRQANFIATSMRLSRWNSQLCKDTGFLDCFDEFVKLSLCSRRSLTEDPVFRIWLKSITKTLCNLTELDRFNDVNLRSQLSELRRIIDQSQEKAESDLILNIEGSCIQIKRFAVDPLIAQVTPPSYQFPSQEAQQRIEESTSYKLNFFLEVLEAALDRIKYSWPPAYMGFGRFVKMIVHVPDADFRSCSAERFSGIIFLSCNDICLLDIEESLIHEYGHQILYNLMEIDPLIIDGNKGELKLPWSGQERDFYGYFHAFYIYIILILYFERVKVRSKEEEETMNQRTADILSGLTKAVTHLESSNQFTLRGWEVFSHLKNEVYQIQERHKTLISLDKK